MLVKAKDVEVSHMLPNLGNGYVVEVLPADEAVSLDGGGYHVALGDGYTYILFHDWQGEENHLILVNDFMLEVSDA